MRTYVVGLNIKASSRSKKDLDNYIFGLQMKRRIVLKATILGLPTVRPKRYRPIQHTTTPVIMASCQSSETTAKFVTELRRLLNCRRAHYLNAVNHPTEVAAQTSMQPFRSPLPMPIDVPTVQEVKKAIDYQEASNGRATGPHGIQPELLKYTEEPTIALSLDKCGRQESFRRMARRNDHIVVNGQR